MTITETAITSQDQWHELRKPNIGASEIGALFGCHEYASAYSLSARKLGLIEAQPDNDMMRRGRLLEPVAVEMLREERQEWKVWQPRAYYCDAAARLGATPDLLVRDNDDRRGVIQIKSVEPSVFARTWHDDDDCMAVPGWIKLQVMLEAHLTDSVFAYVAALVVGHGIHLEMIEVPIEPAMIARMYHRAAIFWEQVDAGKPLDPDYGRDAAALASVLRQDDESELDMTSDNELPAIAARLEAANHAKVMAMEIADECKARILHRIGRAAKVRFAGGSISAKTITRKEHLVAASSFRSLKVRFARGGNGQEILP